MADVKESHYWEQLRTALTAGQWDSSTPAKAPKGTFLSWPELFRKFRKHSKRKGMSHVGKNPNLSLHGTVDIPEAATQLHFLSLLLVTTKQASKENDEQEEVVPNQFEIGDECILYEERRGDVQMAYETLLRLKSSDDVSVALFISIGIIQIVCRLQVCQTQHRISCICTGPSIRMFRTCF